MNIDERPSGSQHEMRREPRSLQIRRVVHIVANGRRMPFSLYNLSSKGAAGRAIFSIQAGAHVTLQFEDGFALEGRVRWARRGLLGIAFRGVLPEALIEPPDRLHRARQRRIETALPATLVAGGQSTPCVVCNASAMGLMIESNASLTPGQIVSVLSNGLDCCGQVCWVTQGASGIRTFSRIDPGQFATRHASETDAAERRATDGSGRRLPHA